MADTDSPTAGASPVSPIDRDLEAHLAAHDDEQLQRLLALLRIPSISALPAHAPDVAAAAEWLAGELRRLGLDDVQVVATPLHPLVTARWHRRPGAPTAIVYCHYDVQPVDPVDQWETAPFEPFVRDGRIVGRGSADDKGQIVMHLAALEALLAVHGALPLNLTFVFEGEEEYGSESIMAWLRANREALRADLVVISDTGFFEGNIPALTVGLRGITYAQVDVYGAPVDLHSGQYGGVVENPVNALARIISALKGPDGRVRIPGFYEDVLPLPEAEQARLAALPFDEEAYRLGTGVRELVGETGFTTLERRGARPTLDVNGIWGGFQGEGAKTIIPAEAHAKVSCRLVANQDPDRIFALLRAHVAEIAPPGVRVEVRLIHGGRPILTPTDHPAILAAARALEAVYGQPPVFIREGGSIPVAAAFGEVLGLPVVLYGLTQPASNAHAPNEWLAVENFERGARAIVRLWQELAELPR
jgi:acetylornithine deacetylase/succinyl-diaminopimelate desuccinylase-like protein